MSREKTTTEYGYWPACERVMAEHVENELYDKFLPVFSEIVKKEKLGTNVLSQFRNIYIPLAAWLANKQKQKPLIIGINGAQGSGKSTLSVIIKSVLAEAFNKSVLHLSIDDLYLSRKKRREKANNIHPLFNVRGVPGTHDTDLAIKILSELMKAEADINIKIPKFNKEDDDLAPEDEWLPVSEPVDIILFEGWCVDAKPQQDHELDIPINELEENEDSDALWRKHVNFQLGNAYQKIFKNIDFLIMLKVPDMESVFEWRSLQEDKLAALCKEKNKSTSHLMSSSEISRFIRFYERITRACLSEMPARADVLLELNKDHEIHNIAIKDSS